MEKTYSGRQLDRVAYPLGGFGTGMICLEGNGSIGKVSLHHRPDLYNEANMFAAVTVLGGKKISRVLEGFVPIPRVNGVNVRGFDGASNGMAGKSYGLPRFRECTYSARFPFPHISLRDDAVPFSVGIEGFSPFIPANADDSSLPMASLRYTFRNDTDEALDAVFYYSVVHYCRNDPLLMGYPGGEEKYFIWPVQNGFVMEQQAYDGCGYKAGAFSITADGDVHTDVDFYRGMDRDGAFDCMTMRWNSIEAGEVCSKAAEDGKFQGGGIAVPIHVEAHGSSSVTVRFCWYVPESDLRYGATLEGQPVEYYKPWYAGKYASITEVTEDFAARYAQLYQETRKFSDTLYASELPDEIMDAIGANLTILKSTTVLRQEDGRFWAFEGTADILGSCEGSCSHVWNYAQAVPHLFPELERTLRETELHEDMDAAGHQQFRTSLPIRENAHTFHAASDGQLGGIMKMYREWRISGDTQWLAAHWDLMITSLEYCIRTWDKTEQGVLREPHHNTYDIEFWGADAMCSSFYLGALKAVSEMGSALGKNTERYETLYRKGREYVETILWNGEYFIQIPESTTLEAKFETNGDPVMEKEGAKYQYGNGCLSDGVCGAWLAKMCGLGDILDAEKVKRHLLSVYTYNLRRDLSGHANPQRAGYALWDEGGLLLCSWPKHDKPSLPFIYSDEVWTGIEYQVASHLASFGYRQEALDIVTILRARYDGEKRNPYAEVECGYWYARALASYGLLQGFTGVRYDAVTKTLYAGAGEYKVFLATATGYGLVTSKDGKITLDVVSGEIETAEIVRL